MLAYVAIVVSLVGGVVGLIQSFVTQQPLWAVGGGGLGIWIWPALRHALKVRQENLAIRLLEIPLSNVKSADEAARLLQEFFKASFFEKGSP